MKKLLSLLLIGLMTACFYNASHAQTLAYDIFIMITDQYGYPIKDSAFISFRNQDSTTISFNPYNSVQSNSGVATYSDTGTVDSNYTDSSITILYKACGQWYTLDTFLHLYSYTFYPFDFYALSVYIKGPCVNPCHAGFFNGYSNDLEMGGSPSLNKGPFIYHWYFGDGTDTFAKVVKHKYATPGTYIVSMVILDTLNGCKDSSSKTMNIIPDCAPYFGSIHRKYGNFEIWTGNNIHPGFQHTWIIGDSVFSNDGNKFPYRFGAGGIKPVKHIVEFPGYCKDSSVNTPNVGFCQTEISGYPQNFRTLTIYPDNNVDTFKYDFGDGTFDTAVGPVSHTYYWNNIFQVKIRDLHEYCSVKSLSVSISQNCANHFSSQVDSLYKMRFYTTQATSFAVRRIIDLTHDTLYGDTVSYYFPARGQYSVQNQFLDSQGTLVCYYDDYVWMNSCGSFDYQQYWNNMIHGEVRFGSSTSQYDSLMVYLIEYDSVAGTLTAVDSAILYSNPNDSGYFAFYELCDSTKVYLVKAALLPGSGIYGNYLPTYYNQSASWSGATKLGTYGIFSLYMVAGTNPGGPGFIGGYISQGANKKFKPLEGIQVNLFDDNDTPLAFDLSDADGYYEFPSLPYGTYRVTVEIMGKPSDSYMITLSAANERAEGQDFEVNSTYISTLNTAIHIPNVAGRIYPNPAKDQLMIEWTEQAGEEFTLCFYTIHGQLIAEFDIERKDDTTSTLDIKDLPRGIYMLQIESGTWQSIHRIQLD